MSRSRLAADAHAGIIVALVLAGVGAAWDALVSGVVGDLFRVDLR